MTAVGNFVAGKIGEATGGHGGEMSKDKLLEITARVNAQGSFETTFMIAALTGYGAGEPRRPLARLAADKLAALESAVAPLLAHERVNG